MGRGAMGLSSGIMPWRGKTSPEKKSSTELSFGFVLGLVNAGMPTAAWLPT